MELKPFTPFLIATLLVACGETTSPDGDPSVEGKADSFESTNNELQLTGDRDHTIPLDDAFQCEGQQFGFIGGWRNPDDQSFELPTFRVNLRFAGGRVPSGGDVIETAPEGSSVMFDGVGYSTDEGGGCEVEVLDLVNGGQGSDFGVALQFRNCELAANGRVVKLEGTVSCTGDGFDLLFEPEPEPDDSDDSDDPNDPDDSDDTMPEDELPTQECSDEDYLGWMDEVWSVLDGVGSIIDEEDQATIDEALDRQPCVGIHDPLYEAWSGEFATRLDDAGSRIDETDQIVLDTVLAARPEPRSEAAFVTWLGVYEQFLREVAPQGGSVIDEYDAAILDLVHRARVDADGEEAYAAWFALAREYFEEMAPSGSARFDDNEIEIYDELLRSKPTAGGGENFAAFRSLYDDFVADIIPSGTAILDEFEAVVLERTAGLRPGGGSDDAYADWTEGYVDLLDTVGSRAGEGAQAGLDQYLSIKPCADDPQSDTVAEAMATLPADLDDDDARTSFVEAASPEACP